MTDGPTASAARASNAVARTPTIRIGVLVSGTGTNLQAILTACARGDIAGRVAIVISSTARAYALARAREAGVPTVTLPPRAWADRESYDAQLADVLEAHAVDLVCLAGFLRILTAAFVRRFAGRIMNVHPALLPAFGGVGMYGVHVHEAVLASGVKVAGCTVHFADETPDGGPIILQAPVPVYDDDTVESLSMRIAEQEHRIYPAAIQLFAQGRLRIVGRRVRVLKERTQGIEDMGAQETVAHR